MTSVREIVDIYQEQMAAHLYRRGGDGVWMFGAIGGGEATLLLASMDVA